MLVEITDTHASWSCVTTHIRVQVIYSQNSLNPSRNTFIFETRIFLSMYYKSSKELNYFQSDVKRSQAETV